MFGLALLSPGPTAYAQEPSSPGLGARAATLSAKAANGRKRSQDQVPEVLVGQIAILEAEGSELKSKNDDAHAIEIYQKLLRLKAAGDTGPDHYALGVLLWRQKKYAQAREHFLGANQLRYNPSLCRFFLGEMAMRQNDSRLARFYFVSLRSAPEAPVRMAARYYLGSMALDDGREMEGIHELEQSLATASAVDNYRQKGSYIAAATRLLEPYKSYREFAGITALSQYDSNVTRAGVINPAQIVPNNLATPKFNLSGFAGISGSPLSSLQWTASYGFSIDRNIDSEAWGYELFSHSPALYLNIHPAAPITGGLKVEGNLILQTQPRDLLAEQSPYVYKRYDFGADVGPFLKQRVSSDFDYQWDVFMRPHRNYVDNGLSGNSLLSTWAGNWREYSRFWHPQIRVNFEDNMANSDDDKYLAIGAGGTDILRVGANHTLGVSEDFNLTRYSQAVLPHVEHTLTTQLNWATALTEHWSILFNLAYVTNPSSVPENYSYNRVLAGLGVSWSL